MEPLLEAGETKELDRWAMTEKGVPGEELMERAVRFASEADDLEQNYRDRYNTPRVGK